MEKMDWRDNDAKQIRLIKALLEGGALSLPAQSIRLIETHISWILLTGQYVYKIKKALDVGFLDFSTLERRRFFCHEEIRLNARMAPDIYLDVVSFSGTPDHPVLGGEPAIEYAVRMHPFCVDDTMDHLLASGSILPSHIDSLADVLADFHLRLPAMPSELPYGKAADLRKVLMENFSVLPVAFLDAAGQFSLAAMADVTEEEYLLKEGVISNRRPLGFVRECHGDLHLGNVVVIKGKAVPFDGIEFDPGLRWIDIMADTAFPFMDFLYYGRRDLAYRFLNAWLEKTGDYGGLTLLPLYASYRAAVRAKVHAIRAVQPGSHEADKRKDQDVFYRYQALACTCLSRQQPLLIITHGLPGSGKTTFSQAALERIGAIRLRSDVERKRLFGLAATANSEAALGKNIYTQKVTEQTYERLHDLARGLLKLGQRVIVDAAFLKKEERRQFHRLAVQMRIPFVIAAIQSDDATLRERIRLRQASGKDASEADVRVLDKVKTSSEGLEQDELPSMIVFENRKEDGFSESHPGWRALDQMLD